MISVDSAAGDGCAPAAHSQAPEGITQYFPLNPIPQKTLYALAELLPDSD
jgi:hypothetical protein